MEDESPAKDTVKVYLDGEPRWVPKRVDSWYALRGALGVQRGAGVAVKSLIEIDPANPQDSEGLLDLKATLLEEGWALLGPDHRDRPYENVSFWEFTPEEEFITLGLNSLEEYGDWDQDEDPRKPWEQDSEAWKNG